MAEYRIVYLVADLRHFVFFYCSRMSLANRSLYFMLKWMLLHIFDRSFALFGSCILPDFFRTFCNKKILRKSV